MPTIELAKVREANLKDYLIRFILGAAISVSAALIVQNVGARFGGIFLAFPSILPASLTLIEKREGTRRADRDAIGAILGGVGLSIFAIMVEKTVLELDPFVSLVIALITWFATSLILYVFLALLHPDLCDKNKD